MSLDVRKKLGRLLNFEKLFDSIKMQQSTPVFPNLLNLVTVPWWSSGLDRQSHDFLVMLKVEGLYPGIAVPFLGQQFLNKNNSTRKSQTA